MNNFSGGRQGAPQPKRIAIDFHDPSAIATPGGGGGGGPPTATPEPSAIATGAPPVAQANPSPGATPAPMSHYADMAQNLLSGTGGGNVMQNFNPNSLLQGGGRGGPGGMSDLVRFSATPEGRAAIQGAIDGVIQQKKSGTNPNTNPYQYIIAALRQAMGNPVTA